jgi:hypothetical protein
LIPHFEECPSGDRPFFVKFCSQGEPAPTLVHPSQILQPTLTIFLKNEAKENNFRVSDCQIQTFLGLNRQHSTSGFKR